MVFLDLDLAPKKTFFLKQIFFSLFFEYLLFSYFLKQELRKFIKQWTLREIFKTRRHTDFRALVFQTSRRQVSSMAKFGSEQGSLD